MHPRNGIEGTHSELVRGYAMRRTKYRGRRVGLSNYFIGAACNVKRYLAHFTGYGFVEDGILSVLTTFGDERSLLPAVANQIDRFFSRIQNQA